MSHEVLLKQEYVYNEKLYEFLATNYDISSLAKRISIARNSKASMINLKKIAENAT